MIECPTKYKKKIDSRLCGCVRVVTGGVVSRGSLAFGVSPKRQRCCDSRAHQNATKDGTSRTGSQRASAKDIYKVRAPAKKTPPYRGATLTLQPLEPPPAGIATTVYSNPPLVPKSSTRSQQPRPHRDAASRSPQRKSHLRSSEASGELVGSFQRQRPQTLELRSRDARPCHVCRALHALGFDLVDT